MKLNKLNLVTERDDSPTILLLEDVEETRDCMVKMLERDGYRIEAARDEEIAVECARRNPPDLILVCIEGLTDDLLATGVRIRTQAGLSSGVSVVVFCCETVNEGEKLTVGDSIYVIRPDDFNQLRRFLSRLLSSLALVA